MPTKFCTQCGSEIADGKRFCGRCGAAVTHKPEPVAAIRPAGPDVRYSAPQNPPAQTPIAPVPVPIPTTEKPVIPVIPLEVPIVPIVQKENSAQVAEIPKEDAPLQAAQASSLPTGQVPELPAKTIRRSPRVLIAAGLAVLVLAGGALGFYEWHKKSTEVAVVDTSTQAQSTPASPDVPAITEPLPKADTVLPPPPSTTATTAAENKPDASSPRPPTVIEKPHPAPSIGNAPRNPAPTPTAHVGPAPIVRETPANSRAGLLRYSGPPVHLGEVITFSGLPGSMLRFSFDHASWQPRISHQPDGTQTLTLRSLTQQDQTQCEVRWEVAQ